MFPQNSIFHSGVAKFFGAQKLKERIVLKKNREIMQLYQNAFVENGKNTVYIVKNMKKNELTLAYS